MTKSKFPPSFDGVPSRMTGQNLRKRYSRFIYRSFSWKFSKKNLEIFFEFEISGLTKFSPKIVIENVSQKDIDRVGERTLNNLVFHLGLIEIPSYWKATCSPNIVVEAGNLSKEQIQWWKNLFIKGMGQFYYENKINWKTSNFLTIKSSQGAKLGLAKESLAKPSLSSRTLVPFAGGRDSIVTLEKLKNQNKEIALFIVNPTGQIKKAAKVSRIKTQIIVRRILDKKLLELNKKGFLNGHTPFTSMLSFLSVLCAVLFNCKHIAFSNEKSSNEGNVKYLGASINHQWAKSSEFEKLFQNYYKKYLAKNIHYFSFLRKYGELEISKMFSKYKRYFPVFSSCNAGMKIKSKGVTKWCGNCPKCLFVYMSLYPLLTEKELLQIFGKDIFENRGLLPTMKGLLGQEKIKPFECVGTKAESKRAFNDSLKKAQKTGNIPYLLTKIVGMLYFRY